MRQGHDHFARGRQGRHRRGLTMIEAMLLLVTISIVAVGAGVGLHAVAKVPSQTDEILSINAEIIDRMEQMKATAWTSMSAKATTLTNTSPGIQINSKYYSCTVTVTDTDANGDGTVDTDYRTITITIGSRSMVSTVCNK